MATTTSSAPTKVVETNNTTKMKISASLLAKLNAWSIALATFFGYATIFVAIAGFTKKWNFSLPFFTRLLGSNVGMVSTALITAIVTLVLAIFALATMNKLTDKEVVKKSWRNIAIFFLAITAVYAIDIVAIIMSSILMIGVRGVQGQLWLSNFLPTLILAGGSVGMFFIAKAISQGKASLIRAFAIVAVSLAGTALLLVIVQQLVAFYGKSSGYSAYRELYDSLIDLGL